MATKKLVTTDCDHLYLPLDSLFRQMSQRYGTTYQRIDLFFCQRCLIMETIKKEDNPKNLETIPDWFDPKRAYVTTDLR